MISVRIENGEITPLTEDDRRQMIAAFPNGIRLTSKNCPQVAAEIEKISAAVLEERKDLYRRLATFG